MHFANVILDLQDRNNIASLEGASRRKGKSRENLLLLALCAAVGAYRFDRAAKDVFEPLNALYPDAGISDPLSASTFVDVNFTGYQKLVEKLTKGDSFDSRRDILHAVSLVKAIDAALEQRADAYGETTAKINVHQGEQKAQLSQKLFHIAHSEVFNRRGRQGLYLCALRINQSPSKLEDAVAYNAILNAGTLGDRNAMSAVSLYVKEPVWEAITKNEMPYIGIHASIKKNKALIQEYEQKAAHEGPAGRNRQAVAYFSRLLADETRVYDAIKGTSLKSRVDLALTEMKKEIPEQFTVRRPAPRPQPKCHISQVAEASIGGKA